MFFNLIALATLAVVASVAPGPANALSVESHNFVRNAHAARHHAVLGKRQTARPRRCRARTTDNASGSSSPTTSSTSTSSSSSSSGSSSSTQSQSSSSSQAPAPAPTTTRTSTSSTPKPTTTKSTSTAAPPAPTWAGERKACITYAGNVNVPKMVAGSNKIACVINWSSWKPEWMGQLKGVDYVPMYWGEKQNADTKKNVVAGFAKYLLGMNEPNQSGQSLMSVGRGIELWLQYVQPLKSQGYTLISPACTNAPSGLTWTRDFINQCGGRCTVDHAALHWYGTDAEAFVSHLQSFHAAINKPLWITEYACQDFSGRNQQCSRDKTFAFMERTQSFMDNTPWVFRYAYFGALHYNALGGVDPVNRLINDDSSASDLGKAYLF